MYVSPEGLRACLHEMHAKADHLIKIWFTLKQMGLRDGGPPVRVTTSNPTPALERLFSYGAKDGSFFVPFAHTPRFKTMQSHAGRSIIQTTVQRWASSGSVVTVDPTGFLDFSIGDDGDVRVATGRTYPIGLGVDRRGFSPEDGKRVSIPIFSFALWYYRSEKLPPNFTTYPDVIVERLKADLGLSPPEVESVFAREEPKVLCAQHPMTLAEINAICTEFLAGSREPIAELVDMTIEQQATIVKSMKTISESPAWLSSDPATRLTDLLSRGTAAALLYGPPRTGKSRAIDQYVQCADIPADQVIKIQLHAGWSYENLMQMFAPDADGVWGWIDGPLKRAIEAGKRLIVIEEANRTNISQALGELFSLIEPSYRGEAFSYTLRSGESFHVPVGVVFLFTLNTVDKSTEEVDDALFGRMAAVEFPPRIEDLASVLDGVDDPYRSALTRLFVAIQEHYPLGHGYFAQAKKFSDLAEFYLAHVRPVLYAHFNAYDRGVLATIDNVVDGLLDG